MNQPDEQPVVRKPDPAPSLQDPQAILEDPRLSRAEKIRRLREWSYDARELEVANEEGMRGKVRSSNLDAVRKALRELEGSSGDEAAQP
jgi:hypothetical protein